MSDIWVRVHGTPIPQGSKVPGKTSTGRLFVREANPRLKDWRDQVGQAIWRTMNERDFIIDPLQGPVQLHVWFYFEKPKSNRTTRPTSRQVGDLDKLLRSICDAGTSAGLWESDDSQVCSISGEKLWADDETQPGCMIHATTLQ